jgi:hypothetical protein
LTMLGHPLQVLARKLRWPSRYRRAFPIDPGLWETYLRCGGRWTYLYEAMNIIGKGQIRWLPKREVIEHRFATRPPDGGMANRAG